VTSKGPVRRSLTTLWIIEHSEGEVGLPTQQQIELYSTDFCLLLTLNHPFNRFLLLPNSRY